MKDFLETPECLMCAAIPGDLTCTLHGGSMTATEVNLRHKYTVEGDRWVERQFGPDPFAPFFEDLLDRAMDAMRKGGMLPPK